MIYIASPYSSNSPLIIQERYERVCLFVDRLTEQGFVAFSPIAYCHPIATRIGMGTTAITWMKFNMSMLRKAEALYLLQLDGWKESKGVGIELNVCKMLSIPIANYSKDMSLLDDHWRGHLPEQL